MKRIVILGFVFIGALSIKSCELDDCMTCRRVTYENGVVISEGSPAEYCDEELDDLLLEDDVIIGDTRSTWECE